MTDPTGMPLPDPDEGSTAPEDSIYEGRLPGRADEENRAAPGAPGDTAAQLPPQETETDLLAARVTGADDHAGMAALWRATMGLPHWWFIAVGEEGLESPAAASIDDQLMLLTFTTSERARHFAVQNGMVAPGEDLRAIALPPHEVVDSAGTYRDSGIGGLMFDPHIAGYFIPCDQLPVVWEAVRAEDTGSNTDRQTGGDPGRNSGGETGARTAPRG